MSSFLPSSSIGISSVAPHAIARDVDLKAVAKVDLHRHLEGAVRLSTMLDLYRGSGHPLPETTPAELSARAQVVQPMGSLEEVLSRFTIAQGAFFDEAACERIAFEAVEDLAADNVRLAELRFSPEFLCEPHGLDWDAAMAAIVRGVERGGREFDVTVGLIAIASRNYGIDSAERTVAFALRHRDHLVAFDLAGDEQAYPPSLYVDVVAELAGSGLKLTTHYGESGGAGVPARGRRGARLVAARARRERRRRPRGDGARARTRGHPRDVPDLEPPDARRRQTWPTTPHAGSWTRTSR